MTDSPTGIIPEDLMYPYKRAEVVRWLIIQPWPGYLKRDMLFAWSRTVGIRMKETEVEQVVASGRT